MSLKSISLSALLSTTVVAALAAPATAGIADLDKDPACHVLTPASAGGPLPSQPNIMILRWLGWSTYEVAYHGKVLLLDAFIDTLPSRRLGLKPDAIKRADAILVGHPHFDHVFNAPQLSQQTGAPIFVSPAGRTMLTAAKVPADKLRIVRGGESIKMAGFTVQTALALHAQHDPALSQKMGEYVKATGPLSADEQALWKSWTSTLQQPDPKDPDSDIIRKGTIAYLVTFDDGITVSFRNSPGEPTDGERALVKSVTDKGKEIDVGIIGYNGNGPALVMRTTGLPLAKTYHPAILLPAHHDRVGDSFPAIATEPWFEALRDELPNTKTAAPIARAPICIDTKTRDLFVNNSAR